MWFVIAAFLRVVFVRLPWSGSRVEVGGRQGFYKLNIERGGTKQLWVGVPCDRSFEFKLRALNEWDHQFARLGLSKRQLTGDVDFDDVTLLISEDARLGALFQRDPALRLRLRELFASEMSDILAVSCLRCRAGKLWVEGRVAKSLEDEPLRAVDSVAAALESLSSALAGVREPRRFDWGLTTALALSACSVGLVVQGFALGVHGPARCVLHVVDGGRLSMLSLGLTTLSFSALLILSVLLLRKTSRAPGVLLEVFFLGGLGCLVTSIVALDNYNVDADASPARSIVAQVKRLSEVRCGKHREQTCYSVLLEPFDPFPTRLLRLGRTDYERLQGARRAFLTVHAGKLGARWIERIDPAL